MVDLLLPLVLATWIHVVSASIWLGGMIVTTLINRGVRRDLEAPAALELIVRVGRILTRPIRYSLYVATASGLSILLNRGISPLILSDTSFYALPLGTTVLTKLLLGGTVLLLAIYHGRLGRLLSARPEGELYQKLRRKMQLVGWITLLLGLTLAAMGTILRFL